MRVLMMAGACLSFLLGCQKNATQAAGTTNTTIPPVQFHLNQAQPKLRTIQLWIGPHELEAEVALSVTEVSTGMMFRTNMTDGEAMLFVFAMPKRREFYMKNCVVALSAGYIDADGVLNEIVDLKPGVTTPVPSKSDQIKYVLEVPQGWFARHNVSTGAVINTSRGPLKNLSGPLE